MVCLLAVACSKEKSDEKRPSLAGTKWELYSEAMAIVGSPYHRMEFTTDTDGASYFLDKNKAVRGSISSFTYTFDGETVIVIDGKGKKEKYAYKSVALVFIMDNGKENTDATYLKI